MSVAIPLLAGLVVFLLGLDILTGALKAQSGEGMRRLITRLTPNRFAGMLTGTVVTVLLQSSTITTVLAVGLVSGGMLTFVQSLGIILGANIGTTMTAQAIAFNTSTFGMVLLVGGFLAMKLVRGQRTTLAATVVFGLGLVFLGMDLMGDAVRPLRSSQAFLDLMSSLTNPLLGMLVGAAFTAAVQSSTAATGVAIAMATEGLIPLEAGVAIILGSNIGTCVTAGLAAVGKPPEAVRTAAFHILINVVGALAWLFFIDQLVDIAVALSPSYPELTGIDRRAAETPRQFAMAHTVFNLSTALVLVWFLGPIARLLVWLIPDRPTPAPPGSPSHLDDALLSTPWAALEAAREEIGVLGQEVETMARLALPALAPDGLALVDGIAAGEATVDARYHHIVRFLRAVAASSTGPEPSRQAAALLDVADELEGIADTMDLTIAATARELHRAGRPLAPAEVTLLEPVAEVVLEHLHQSITGVVDPTSGAALVAARTSAEVERRLAGTAGELRQRLASGVTDVPEYAVVDDVLEQYRRVFGASTRIVRARLTLQGSEVLTETSSLTPIR